MTSQDTAEAKKPEEQGESIPDLDAKVVSLVSQFRGEPRTSYYSVGQGVFDSPEHCAEVCGTPEMPDHAAMGYTPKILAYLRAPKDCSDRREWP